jgi:hypothetical protein
VNAVVWSSASVIEIRFPTSSYADRVTRPWGSVIVSWRSSSSYVNLTVRPS